MRRRIVALLMSVAIGGMALAQTRIPREVHLGVIGGVNNSEYTFAPKISQLSVNGYTFGVAARYIEETYFGLQAELLLTRRGFADDFKEAEDIYYTRYLTYLELPVMAHVYFPMGKHNEVSFDAGPKFGLYLFDAEDKLLPEGFGITGQYANYRTKHHELPIEGNHRVDYGIQAGLGYEFKFDKMSVMLQGRYYYGLGNLWPDSKADDFEQSSVQSIQVVMSLWWHYKIRGKKVSRQ